MSGTCGVDDLYSQAVAAGHGPPEPPTRSRLAAVVRALFDPYRRKP